MAAYEDIITQFEGLIDDNLDATLEQNLANRAVNSLEDERDWEYLKDVDQTQTASTGDTYLSMKTLPANFRRLAGNGKIYVGSDLVPYVQIPFENRIKWKDITHRFYLNMANGQYALCGSVNPGGTIYLPFVKTSPTLGPGITPLMPPRFTDLIAYKMTMMYPAIDQGDKSRAWDDRWKVYYDELHDRMVEWDATLKMNGQQNDHRGFIDLSGYPNIVDMDR